MTMNAASRGRKLFWVTSKVLSQHFPKETKDNHNKHQSGKT
jgi:hypothetical protein